jgi:CRP-like cAMP-binding protein
MIRGDSRKKLIPPTLLSVKAGFVVYSPQDEEKKIILLNEGELVALDPKANNKVVFKIRPGNLVGVGSLLEREPIRYVFQASVDSSITVINDECMESELKSLPVWLLAVIKAISARTRRSQNGKSARRSSHVLQVFQKRRVFTDKSSTAGIFMADEDSHADRKRSVKDTNSPQTGRFPRR